MPGIASSRVSASVGRSRRRRALRGWRGGRRASATFRGGGRARQAPWVRLRRGPPRPGTDVSPSRAAAPAAYRTSRRDGPFVSVLPAATRSDRAPRAARARRRRRSRALAARAAPDEAADHLVAAERLGDGQRVGVEVEQAPQRATAVRGREDRRGGVRSGRNAASGVSSTTPVPWESASARR